MSVPGHPPAETLPGSASPLPCGDTRLSFDQAGSGEALVLVHGAWTHRRSWDPVFPALAEQFRVIRYDRRGYGDSPKPGTSCVGHARDLVELLRRLELSRVILVGNSLGALIAMRAGLAAPGLVRLVIAHEAPLLQLLDQDPAQRAFAAKARAGFGEIAAALRAGNREAGARLFIERTAALPGAWEALPEVTRQELVAQADAFLPEAESDQEEGINPSTLLPLSTRLIITRGDRSSLYLRQASDRLHQLLPSAGYHVFTGAGHVPHQTRPEDFVVKTLELARRE